MEILNNRELAIIIWLVIVSVYVIISPRMSNVRKSLKNVINAFFKAKILSVLLLMILYVCAEIKILSNFNLWNMAQLKNTIFWLASFGFLSLFKLDSIKNDRIFFKQSVLDNLKLLAIFQFIIGMYTFPFWIEFVMLPILVVIGGMSAIVDSEEKYEPVKKLINFVLVTYGSIVIAFTIYKLVTGFEDINQTATAYDFSIPPLLTLMYIPFIFIMMVYSTYESATKRIRVSIKNNFLKKLAIVYAFIVFNFRLNSFENWVRHVICSKIQTHHDLIETFRHILKLQKAEKNPLEVPIEKGWSPYKAKNFLLAEGFKTEFYNASYNNDIWYASSNMVNIGENIILDYLQYYIEGTENYAKSLEILLNVNDPNEHTLSHDKLLKLSNTLIKVSLLQELTEVMKSAILKGEDLIEEYGNKQISIIKNLMPGHRLNGYDLKFTISCI